MEASKELANLHNQIWPERSHSRDADARFGSAVGCSRAAKDHGCCDSALRDSQKLDVAGVLSTAGGWIRGQNCAYHADEGRELG